MIEAIFSENTNFELFGIHHWGAIIFFIIVGVLLIRYGKTLNEEKQVKVGVISAFVVLGFGISYLLILIALGDFDYKTMLPLNFCVILPYFMPWLMRTKNKTMYGILYFGILGGTMQGIITPHLDGNAFPSFIYIKFWVEHAGLIILILYATIVYGMRPTWKDLRNSILFLFAYFLIFLMLINYLIGSNYGYTMSKPPSSSVLDFFGPWPIYIIVSICVALPVFFLLYLPFFIKDLRAKKV